MTNENKVLAQVAGHAITELEVEEMLRGLGQRGQQYNNPQGREILLDQLINQRLIVADALKSGMDREEPFKVELQKAKEELLASYAISKLLRYITVQPADVRKFYDEHQDRFLSEETVEASHILVDDEEQLKNIAEEIESGAITFEDAAKKYSKCPSAQEGGKLGEFSRGKMVPEFEKPCFELEVGQVSEPVKTPFGWHLIRLDAKNEPRQLAFDEVKEELHHQLVAEKQQKTYTSKINQLKIMFPVDKF